MVKTKETSDNFNGDGEAMRLLKTWILAAFVPGIPKWILCLLLCGSCALPAIADPPTRKKAAQAGQSSGAHTLRILNIGDSLSSGRHLHALQARLVEAGFSDYLFVGPVKKGGDPKSTHRQAYGGMNLKAMLHGRLRDGKPQPGAIESVPEYRPNIILLMGGINNIVRLSPGNLAPIQTEWNELIDYLTREAPDAHLFASNIISVHPDRKWAAKQPIIDQFNAWMKEEIAARSAKGQKIIYVDQNRSISPEDFRGDGLHLLPSGENKIGDAWFEALRENGMIPVFPKG